MPNPKYLTATLEEIDYIANSALDIIGELGWAKYDGPEPDDDDDGVVASLYAAIAGLQYCVVAAAPLAAPALVPTMVDCLMALRDYDDYDNMLIDAAAVALLRKVGRATDAVRELVESADDRDRLVVAQGLRPVNAPEIAILRELAGDTSLDVRTAARAALEPVGGVPWWCAWFTEDPNAHPAALESSAVRAAIRAVERLDAVKDDAKARWKGLARAVRALPDALAVDLAKHALRHAPGYRMSKLAAAVGAALLERAGGVDAVLTVVARWNDQSELIFPSTLLYMVNALPDARRGEVCFELARIALGAPPNGSGGYPPEILQMAADVAGKCWPSTLDPSPLLDDLIARVPPSDESGFDRIASDLGSAFSKFTVVEEPLLKRIAGLRLLGYPRGSKSIDGSLDVYLRRAPRPYLRAVAERAVLTDDPKTILFGLECLYEHVYDRRRDPSRRAMLRAWLASPRHRPQIFESITLARDAARILRPDLRSGKLTFDEAASVMWHLASVGGGAAALDDIGEKRHKDDAPTANEWSPTAEEWGVYRALRAKLGPGASYSRHEAAALFPPGPWEPSDRAFIVRMIEESAENRSSIWMIAHTLSAKAMPGDDALFDRLLVIANDENDALDLQTLRRELETRLRAKRRRTRAAAVRAELRVVRGGRA